MADFLESLGQGLRNAGQILSPQVYQAETRDWENLQKQAAARNNLMAGLIIQQAQNGSMDLNVAHQALSQMGFGNAAQLIQPSPAALADARLRQQLGGLQPSAMTGGGLMDTLSKVNPADLIASPMGQNLLKLANTIQSQQSLEEFRKIEAEARLASLGKPYSVIQGNEEVQYVNTPNGPKEVGRGPRFARQVAPVVNVQGETGIVKTINGLNAQGKPTVFGVTRSGQVKDLGITPATETGAPHLTDEQVDSMSWQDLADKLNVPLTGEALHQAALAYYPEHKMPALGLSGKGQMAAARIAILQAQSKIAKELGATPEEAATMPASWKANMSALNSLTKDLNTFEPYKRMLDTNADIAVDLAKKINRTAPALVNKPINWLQQNAANNPDVSEYLAQIRIVQPEAARVIMNPRIVGELTDSARKEIESVINGNAPVNVVERVLQRLKNDGTNRFDRMREQQQTLISQMRSMRPTGSASAPKAPSSFPLTNSKGWKLWKDPNGNQAYVSPDGKQFEEVK